jgi:hypothetical protein
MDAKVKKNPSALKSLSEKCQLSRFCDYFVICGLDIENGLEAELLAGELLLRRWIFLFSSSNTGFFQMAWSISTFPRWTDLIRARLLLTTRHTSAGIPSTLMEPACSHCHRV